MIFRSLFLLESATASLWASHFTLRTNLYIYKLNKRVGSSWRSERVCAGSDNS